MYRIGRLKFNPIDTGARIEVGIRSEVEHHEELEQCIARFASCPLLPSIADPDGPRWKANNSSHQKKKIVERTFLAVVDYALGQLCSNSLPQSSSQKWDD